MKRSKVFISVVLSLLMLMGTCIPAIAATAEEWQTYWDDERISRSGLTMQPGSDESERNFSWYIPEGEGICSVLISTSPDMTDAEEFSGESIDTWQGDKCAKVTVSGLEKGQTYYYTCVSDGEKSETHEFKTLADDNFKALFVSDVHINAEDIVNHSYNFDELVNQADNKFGLDMIISAGDQTVIGTREELEGICASPRSRELTFAFCMGNHDRKSVDYRYFKNLPNEFEGSITHFQSADYWFTRGNVLFLVINSNSPNALDHRKFVREAVESNPDIKWRVAVMHHDLYAGTIEHRESENKLLRLLYSSIFDEFHMDLVLLGHSHHFSVSDVIYGGKKVQGIENGENILNPKGTVYTVASSISNPREGELKYSDLTAMGMEDPLTPLYNVIEFSDEKIKLTVCNLDTDEEYRSFSIEKDENNKPRKLGFWRKIGSRIVDGLSFIYSFFEIFSHYRYIRGKGYDVSIFDYGMH